MPTITIGSQVADRPTLVTINDAMIQAKAGPHRNGFLSPNLEFSLGIKKTIGIPTQIVIDEMNPAKPRIKVHCRLTIKAADVTLDYSNSDSATMGS